MPFAAPHNLLVVIGSYSNNPGGDVFQFSMRQEAKYAGPDALVGDNVPGILTDIQADLQTWWNAVKGAYNTGTRLTGFKYNRIGVDGLYANQTTTNQVDLTGATWAGTSTAKTLPGQVAITATLLTDAARGLASKGRFYLPAPTVDSVDVGGRIVASTLGVLQGATGTLLTNLNNWPGLDVNGAPGRIQVHSATRAGAFRDVTSLSIGNRFDVQRRRANKVLEVRGTPVAIS